MVRSLRMAYQWSVNWLSERLFDFSEYLSWCLVGRDALRLYRRALKTGSKADIELAIGELERSRDRFVIADSVAQGHIARCLRQLQQARERWQSPSRRR